MDITGIPVINDSHQIEQYNRRKMPINWERHRLEILLLCLIAAVAVGICVTVTGPLLAMAIAIALAIGLLLLTDARFLFWSVLAVIILLPFATLPIDIGVTPTFLELTIGGTVVVAICAWAWQGRQHFTVSPVGWVLLIFIGIIIGSFVRGISNAMPTVTSARRFADMLLSLSFFYLVINLLNREDSLLTTHKMVLLMGCLAALIGIFLYVIPSGTSERLLSALGVVGYPTGSVLRYIEDDSANPMRAIGTSVDPNVYGGLLAFMGGMVIPQLFIKRGDRGSLFYWAIAGIIGIALLLTFSRGSLFGLAVAVFVLGLLRERRLIFLMLAAAVVVLVLPQTQAYVLHFIEGVRGQDLATQMRFGEYKDALILVGRYPMFGVGFTGSPDVDIYIGVSMVYLLIAEECGIVGLLAFLAVLFTFFAYTWPRAKMARGKAPELEAVILGTQTAVLAGMVSGTLDHYLFNLSFPHAAGLLWATVGIGVAASIVVDKKFGEPLRSGVR